MEREQRNFPNAPLAAEGGSDRAWESRTTTHVKFQLHPRHCWNEQSYFKWWRVMARLGPVLPARPQQPEQLLVLLLPRMGKYLMLEISRRKCINRKETSFFVPSCSQIWWDQGIFWNLMKTLGQAKAGLTPVKWRHTNLKAISYSLAPGTVFPVSFLLLPPLGGAGWMLSVWCSSAEIHCTSW